LREAFPDLDLDETIAIADEKRGAQFDADRSSPPRSKGRNCPKADPVIDGRNRPSWMWEAVIG
jgi:hypothetical protein